MIKTSDWTSFVKRINISASPGDIYKAWATQSGIEGWFLRNSVFTNDDGHDRKPDELVSRGDSYSWFWFGWPDEMNQKGVIIEANGTDLFQFTFHDPMVVSVSILEEEGEIIVRLEQENIPADDESRTNYFVGCGEGWTFYLANLKSVLEGGIDLRNKNESIKDVINS